MLETFIAVAGRLSLIFFITPMQFLWLITIAPLLGNFIISYLFSWLAHKPHDNEKRYQNTVAYAFNE